MDNSTRRQSASSSNISDPFRDPDLPSQTSLPEQPSNTPFIPTSHEVFAPNVINDSQSRGQDNSNTSHEEELSSSYSSSQSDVDVILPIQPAHFATSLEIVHGTSRNGIAGSVHTHSTDSIFALSELVTRREAGEPVDRSPKTVKAGKRKISITKWISIIILLAINAFLIFSTWWWSKYYYIYLPFITITVALNCIMVFSVILHTVIHKIMPEKEDIPSNPESMVMLLPCYNETREECLRSLDSLVEQININEHKKAIMIVCDGRVRGVGMEKTTADYLLEDILTGPSTRESIEDAYTAWDNTSMDVVVQKGLYGGIPYFCIIKQQNQGKRDSLLLVRSFLYNFNIRATKPAVNFSPYFFGRMTSFLTVNADISNVDVLIGLDADTVFAPDCISELLKQSHYKQTVGVCGYVAVDFSDSNWSPWSLYQSSEYTISQCLRRLHQSIATHKVSCLPGCCQLLKVCETTCGDHILWDLFGYYPRPTDNLLKQIRATASEDRNHVCLMLSAHPKARTRQALKARAYTDVPHSWSVFLSQRRRWTLGATSNDFFLIFAPGIYWFERILALANVVTWLLNPFIIASIASFIRACTIVEYKYILAFAAVMILPLIYYILIVAWKPRRVRERMQYLAGLAMYIFLGPFLNIIVLSYALWNIDNFAWGKTRKVIKEPEAETEKVTNSGAMQEIAP